MPNIEVWTLLLLLAIWIISIITTYFITKNVFSSRLNHVLQNSENAQLQYEKTIQDASHKIDELTTDRQELIKEKTELTRQITSSISDIKNHKSRLEEFRIEVHELKQQLKIVAKEKNDLQIDFTEQVAENKNLNKRLEDERQQLEKLNEKFQKEFENLAQKILDEKSEKFASQNKENLSLILNPLQEKINFFEKRVEDTHKESIEHGARLQQQIIGLKELNEQMSTEANNLTRALKGDSKTQGNWGEMILESVLEKSGLQKDSEYFVQTSHLNEDGRRSMPDVIIELPGNKRMIIDAKVSLVAYEKYVNEGDPKLQAHWRNKHLQSIERHIQQLSKKNYHTIYPTESPDFVLLFIPIESAFALASQENTNIYLDAFEQNIILVTPTTLLAVLRTIDSMWQNEKQKQNAIEIATQAGKLYDTFVKLLEELEKVGKQMDTAKNTYDSAMKKLMGRRSLFNNIQKLKQLGAKTSKQIDEKYINNVETNYEEE